MLMVPMYSLMINEAIVIWLLSILLQDMFRTVSPIMSRAINSVSTLSTG